MTKIPVATTASAEQVVKDIRRATRKLHSSEEMERVSAIGPREPATPDCAVGPSR